MTDPETLADEDLSIDTDGSYEPSYADPDTGEPAWGELDWEDDPLNDWRTYPVQRPQPSPAAPWFRNPRLLFALIAVAAATLVVATVLLITGKQSVEIPTAPQLSTRTTPTSARSAPRPPAEPAPTTATPSSVTEAPSPGAEEPLPVTEADQPAQVSAEPLPPTASATRSPAGPRINVTRTPMSFTPGKH